jgi:O-antigen/teichoic acid export membrane protein
VSIDTLVTRGGTAITATRHGRHCLPQRSGRGFSRPPARQVKVDGPRTELLRYLRTDQMARNSLYLLLTSGVQAALGFTFWVVAARFFSTSDVGRASSLISAATLIGFFGLLGLNSTFVRYLPNTPERDGLISAGLLLVGLCSAGMALVYVLLTPLLAPRIAFIAHSLPLAMGFVLFTAAGAINVLTDSVFIAAGKSNYNVLIDGIIAGVTKVALVMVLVGTGAYGIFCATSGGFVAATLASLVITAIVLRWRPSLKNASRTLKPVLRFSGANYAGNVLNLLPILIVPLIVLDRIGAAAAAYFFVSFQLASLLYSTVYSVEQAFLAEGASIGTVGRALMRRSFGVLMALCIPAFILVLFLGHQLLMAFGAQYGDHAEGCLIRLTAAVFPIALNNWLLTVLRLSNRLKAVVFSNAVYACTVCGLAWVLAPHGLSAIAVAWPIGACAGTLVAAVAAIGAVSRRPPPRHRRSSTQVC